MKVNKAINKTNFDEFSDGVDSSSVNLFLVGTNNGDNKCQIYQEYPQGHFSQNKTIKKTKNILFFA